MRVAFAGTPAFAVASLGALLAHGFDVVGVFTQPDRPAGRGRRLAPPPVKTVAERHGIAVHQPRGLRDDADIAPLVALAPDVFVVAAYGVILPARVLAIPRLGCINVHASLLPRWRGAAPIQRAIIAGDSETGISIMAMDAGLDTGDVLATAACPIGPDDTSATLHDRLADLGSATLVATLPDVAAGDLEPHPQDECRATYAARITKDEARIEWGDDGALIERRVRAFDPWPVAFTTVADGAGPGPARLRVWGARVRDLAWPDAAPVPGTVVAADRDAGIVVATGRGTLELTRVQAAGGRPMPARDFLNAHPLACGAVLGSGDG